MPTRLEILHTFMTNCNAESVHVLTETGRTVNLEVIINRDNMTDCVKNFLKEWEGSVNRIERIHKSETGSEETGHGLYRYTLVIEK